MVYYPTVFIATSSPVWNAIRGWAILYFQVVTRARWTTVRNIYVFNDQHNAFSFTCCNFPGAFLIRRITPWIIRTGKNSWWLLQGCHIRTDCKQNKWNKYWGQSRRIIQVQERNYLTWEGLRTKPKRGLDRRTIMILGCTWSSSFIWKILGLAINRD